MKQLKSCTYCIRCLALNSLKIVNTHARMCCSRYTTIMYYIIVKWCASHFPVGKFIKKYDNIMINTHQHNIILFSALNVFPVHAPFPTKTLNVYTFLTTEKK